MSHSRSTQCGFGAIAAIVILVILSVLAAAILSISSTQQITSAQDVMSARAWHAARAGNEWGLYQAIKAQTWPTAATTCDTASFTSEISETLDLSDTGFHVTVFCGSQPYNEGETVPGTPNVTRIYRIRAVACPAATCPSTDAAVVSGPGYVERTRVVIATN